MNLAAPVPPNAATPESFDERALEPVMLTAARPPRVFTHGRGSWLWDSEGRAYLDMVQGWAVNTLGHAPAPLVRALSEQAARLLTPGPGFHNDQALRLAQRLTALSGLSRCFFTNSGAEANEGAIKLARKFGQVHRGGAFEVVTMAHSFHGRTLATMCASGKPGFDTLFAPVMPGFAKARLNDIDSVAAALTPSSVAVLVGPIQGEAGVIEAHPQFLRDLRALCDRHDLLLMFDEVQTGVGRTGTLWGFEDSGVRPDVMTLGKGLGGGVPIAAVLARAEVCCFVPGDLGGTYNGNALVCAAALAVLDAVTAPGFLDGVRLRGAQLRAGLDRLGRRLGSAPSLGRGLMLALDLPEPDQAVRLADALRGRADRAGMRSGMLVNAIRPQRLRWIPALNVTAPEIAQALDMLEEAVLG